MLSLRVLSLLALAGLAAARCPNSCSGHGSCSTFEKCTCWPNWMGADCGLRRCEYGPAWTANDVSGNPHSFAECSNKGICDRSSGVCQCFDQFEGSNCQRNTCPSNGCSGHGRCRFTNDQSMQTGYSAWDAKMVQACLCDGDWHGADCSQRHCVYGNDPLTTCDGGAQDLHIQRITVLYSTTSTITGDVTAGSDDTALVFTDPYGNNYVTPRITDLLTSGADTRIKKALEGLPNFAIPSVGVSIHSTGAGTAGGDVSRTFWVTFNDARNTGLQNLLAPQAIGGCAEPGCYPKYAGPYAYRENFVAGATGDVFFTADQVLPRAAGANNDAAWDGQIFVKCETSVCLWRYTANHDTTELTSSTGTSGETDIHLTADNRNRIPIKAVGGSGFTTELYISFKTGVTDVEATLMWDVATIVVDTYQSPHVNIENAECSNRGQCDQTTGLCTCFEGFWGQSCHQQTILV